MFIIGVVTCNCVSLWKRKETTCKYCCIYMISSSQVLLCPPQPGHADVLWVCRGLRSACQLQRRNGGHGKYHWLQTSPKLLSSPCLSTFTQWGQHQWYYPTARWSKSLFTFFYLRLSATSSVSLHIFICLLIPSHHHLVLDPSVSMGLGDSGLAAGGFLLRLPVHTDPRGLPCRSLWGEHLSGCGCAGHRRPHCAHPSSCPARFILAVCTEDAGGLWRGKRKLRCWHSFVKQA